MDNQDLFPPRSEMIKILGACFVGIVFVLVLGSVTSDYSKVEEAWTVIGVIGFIFALGNLNDAVLDHRAFMQIPSGPRTKQLWEISTAGIRQEIFRSLKMMIVVAIGLVSGFTEPPVPDAVRKLHHIPVWTTTSIILTSGIFLLVAITVIQTLFDRRLRKVIYGRPQVKKIEKADVPFLHEGDK